MSLSGKDLSSTPVKNIGDWWAANGSSNFSSWFRPRLMDTLKRQNYTLRGLTGFMMTCATIGFWVQLPFHDAVEGLDPPKKWAPKDGHGHHGGHH